MDLIIKSLRSRFENVKNASTDTVYSWLLTAKLGDAVKFKKETGLTCENLTNHEEKSFDKVLLVDVREPEERIISWIPGAQIMSPKLTDEDVNALVEQAKGSTKEDTDARTAVVCYCSLGYRGLKLAKLLDEKFEQTSSVDSVKAYNLEGGIFKWANEGRPIVNAKGSTPFVHPYNFVFSFTLDSYRRKWS